MQHKLPHGPGFKIIVSLQLFPLQKKHMVTKTLPCNTYTDCFTKSKSGGL